MKATSYQDNFIEKAKEHYYRIKKQLEEKYPGDQYVSIDPETGEYVVGKTAIEVMEKSEKHHPKGQFFVAQLGRISGLLK